MYLTEVDLIIGKLLMKWFIVKDYGSIDNNFCHLKKKLSLVFNCQNWYFPSNITEF